MSSHIYAQLLHPPCSKSSMCQKAEKTRHSFGHLVPLIKFPTDIKRSIIITAAQVVSALRWRQTTWSVVKINQTAIVRQEQQNKMLWSIK